MRTKNAKRLWPVPATLAVVALAAFLAFGLMATTGAQPAEAQDDPDCTVENGASSVEGADTPLIGNTLPCSTSNSSAVIALEGNPGEEDEDEVTVWVYAQDGTIAGGSTLTDVWDYDSVFAEAPDAPKATRFSAIRVKIPEAEAANVGGGGAQQQKMNITVSPAPGKSVVTLYVYYGDDAPIPAADFNHDGNTAASSPLVKQIDDPDAGASGEMTLTFLGQPAVGKDGADLNKGIDDEVMEQCVVDNATSKKVVAESTNCESDSDKPADVTWVASTAVTDASEIRSIVVGYTAGAASDPVSNTVIDGKSKDHTLDANDETAATVYVRVEDAAGSPLPGADVTFNATVDPSDLQVDVRATHTEDALTVIDSGTVEAGKTVMITAEMRAAGIVVNDAVASRSLTRLPTGKPYRITMEVMADSVPLGSVVISREGQPYVLKAGVFNEACLDGIPDADGDGSIDYSEVNVVLTNTDCDDSGMARRFGAGDVIVVKSHLEDSLGTVIGEAADMDIELSDDFDDPLDADGETDITTPIPGKVMPAAWVYVVDNDAQLGDHMITVSTTAVDKDDNAIASVTRTVTVAGPPDDYAVDGSNVIELGGAEEYTVTATDENGGVPHFAESDDNLVNVAVQPVTTLVTGLTASRQLELDKETGMGSFTVYAALDATHGNAGRIIVGPSDNLTILNISFGENRAPMAGAAIADRTVDAGSMVMVQSNFSDLDGDMLSYTAMSDDEMVATAMVDMDGMVTITGVAVGMATITVTATDMYGAYAMQTIMVTVMMALPMEPGIPMSVMAEATSHDMVTVSWASPADDGGSDITGYMVQRGYMDADDMMSDWMDVDPAHMGMDMMYMDMGLMAETTYYYRVLAMNAVGNGEWSDGMAMATTDAPASTELTAPSVVVVSSLPNTQSISVTWDTTSIENAQQIKVVLFNSGVTAVAKPLITINAANDPGVATFNDVPDGMYIVVVASFRTGERHQLSDLEPVTVE